MVCDGLSKSPSSAMNEWLLLRAHMAAARSSLEALPLSISMKKNHQFIVTGRERGAGNTN